MKTKKSEKEIIIENSERAIELINKIYDDFDEMNGALHELSEVLDSEEHSFFFSIWNYLPTYSTFDDLKGTLIELKEKQNKEK
jgi:hypothetical protein